MRTNKTKKESNHKGERGSLDQPGERRGGANDYANSSSKLVANGGDETQLVLRNEGDEGPDLNKLA